VSKPKLIRITTVPVSLDKLLEGQLAFMKEYFNILAVSSDKNYLEKIGLREGVNTYTIELTRKITPVKDIRALYKMYRLFLKEKPFIVHTHTPKAGTIGMVAAWLANVPHRLHTIAGLPLLETKGIKRYILTAVEKATYACATDIYSNSYGLYKIILDNNFLSPNKIKVLGHGSSNGINLSFFNPRLFDSKFKKKIKDKFNIQENDYVFIYVGRVVKNKGINELVRAFSELQLIYRDIKLLLVGTFENDLDPLSEYTYNQIQINKNIIYTGYQTDVRPFLAIAKLFVFPSYREGFPNVVMQAGAMGLPSIVTDINGCNEIIKNKKNGIIIPPKNAEILKGKMELLLLDKNLYRTLQKNTRKMIASRYQQQLIWDELLCEYRKLN